MHGRPWALASLVFLSIGAGCGKKDEPVATTPTTTTTTTTGATTGTTGTNASTAPEPPGALKDLKIDDVKQGTGPAAANGDSIWVLYTGRITNAQGKVFDSTDQHDNKAFAVKIGGGQVIKGWDQGLVGIKRGGERNLFIPYRLAYGDNGQGGTIPPKTDLFFNIKAVELLKQGDEDTVDIQVKKPGSGPKPKVGDKVTVSYKGTLPTGQDIDKADSISFVVGRADDKGQTAMPGIDNALRSMNVGEEAILTIPPRLGIPTGTQTIPANSVLIYDLTLKKIG